MLRTTRYVLIAAFLAVSFAATSSAQVIGTESGYVAFHSRVPLHNFTGESETLVGQINLEDGTVDFYVDLESLRTGNRKRDKDMRRSLNTDEHPFASFYGTLSGGWDADRTDAQAVTVQGEFTVNGLSNDVEVEGTLQFGPDGVEVIAEWELSLEDYEIEPPSLLLIKVDEIQRLEIRATLQPTESD